MTALPHRRAHDALAQAPDASLQRAVLVVQRHVRYPARGGPHDERREARDGDGIARVRRVVHDDRERLRRRARDAPGERPDARGGGGGDGAGAAERREERCARSLFEATRGVDARARDVAQGEEDVEERPRQDEDVDRAEGVAAALDGAGEPRERHGAARRGLTTRSVVARRTRDLFVL
jgi:hypothetical protein